MQFRRQSNGQIITLETGSLLGTGGEARVYSVAKDSQLVAKVYHRPNLTSANKLAVMLANPPEESESGEGQKSIAWPVDLLLPVDGGQEAVGYLMPRVAGMRRIADYYNPKIRRQYTPLFNYLYLHRTARNLSAAMHNLHARGYLIGDVNESNILVSETALVVLVDTDSFQVRDEHSGRVFRCGVGKPEFTPPELQGQSLDEVLRLPEHDLFGLAVLIFQLLMEGAHPFAGVYHGDGEPPAYEARISSGYFPYGRKAGPFTPAPVAPRFETLNPNVQRLFVRCFEEGHENPKARPAALEWRETLTEAEDFLIACRVNEQHRYSNHLRFCPWCERAKLLNGRDPFPSRRVVQSGQHVHTASSFQQSQTPSQTPPPMFASVSNTSNIFRFISNPTIRAIVIICMIVTNLIGIRIFMPNSRSTPASVKYAPYPPVVEKPKTSEDVLQEIEDSMLRIPSGTFIMGSKDFLGESDEFPQHLVTISSFFLSQLEVTQEQWRAVAELPTVKLELQRYPSKFRGDRLPVESVSWEEAVEFCERLSRKAGKKYRLPTEAEWEYACRAGTVENYAKNQYQLMWYKGNSNGAPSSVGMQQPNGWGLYDMYGNVSEWCSDWYDKNYYSQSPTESPTGPQRGSQRIIRGGGWDDTTSHCRAAYRDKLRPDVRVDFLGFRLARTP